MNNNVNELNNNSIDSSDNDKGEIKTIKILVTFFYDWQSSHFSKLIDLFDVLDLIFEYWHGNITSRDTRLDLYFHKDWQGENSVKDYFTSRNFEIPPSYFHDHFIQGSEYHIQQVKLWVSITTLNKLFINKKGVKINFDEFKAILSEELKFSHSEGYRDGVYFCPGFNINVKIPL